VTELIELQTGQVSFLSGLLAGFSLTIAANVVQLDMRRVMPRVCLTLLVLSGLLFLIALYVDVRLTIELAGITNLSEPAALKLASIRYIGTHCATLAYVVFIVAVGSLGWLASAGVGIFSSILAAGALGVLGFVWLEVAAIQTLTSMG
jgi:hypothetical protein